MSLSDLEDLYSFCSSRLGVVKALQPVKDQSGALGFASFHACVGDYPEMKYLKPNIFGGAGFVKEQAMASSIAEALERYSSCMLSHNREVERHSISELHQSGRVFLNPLEKWPFHPEQTPKLRLITPTDSEQMNWLEGRSLSTGQPTLLPEFLVALRSDLPIRHWVPTTNGCAVDKSFERACLKALFELIERDAILENWWLRKKPKRVNVDSVIRMPEFLDLKETLCQFEDRLHILWLEKDHGYPAFLVALRGRQDEPACTTGASAGLEWIACLRKALTEAFGLFRGASRGGPKYWRNQDRQIDQIRNFRDHWTYYSQERNVSPLLEFFSGEQIEASEVGRLVQRHGTNSKRIWPELRKELGKLGYEVYFTDITARELRAKSFYCARAVSADFIMLNSSHALRAWGHPRLLAQVQGLSDFNPFPHPVP